jgi:hypothetical protein
MYARMQPRAFAPMVHGVRPGRDAGSPNVEISPEPLRCGLNAVAGKMVRDAGEIATIEPGCGDPVYLGSGFVATDRQSGSLFVLGYPFLGQRAGDHEDRRHDEDTDHADNARQHEKEGKIRASLDQTGHRAIDLAC